MADEQKITFNFKLLNRLIIIFVAIIIILLFTVDLAYSIEHNEHETFRFWWYDANVGFNTGAEKGPGMLISLILNIIAGVLFFIVSIKMNQVRKAKNNSYLSKYLFYTAVYLGIGRIIESFYIITETDLRGLLFVVGRLFIPLDNLAMIIFFGVCVDVFFSVEFVKQDNLAQKFDRITWGTFFAGWLAILGHFSHNNIVEVIVQVLIIGSIAIIILISLVIEKRILQLIKKVEENKKALSLIGQMLVLYICVVILSLVLIITQPDLTQYIFRAIKNLILIIIALFYFPAFINPALRRKSQ
jgi:hypothetical protein